MQLQDLEKRINRTLSTNDVPLASQIIKNIPIYNCQALKDVLPDGKAREALKEEIAQNLLNGSGAIVLRGAFQDPRVVDAASGVFEGIMMQERLTKTNGADHFAGNGVNTRVWNSLEKLCRACPEVFVAYHGNEWIALASEAWLGPAYQMTAQINVVRPGGKAQSSHCDYHMGFMTSNQVKGYPAHVHAFSAQLTLQGAVAHCDMPVESGTTKLLPFSQTWPNNYQKFRDDDVKALFEQRYIQLPLSKGDLLFFSPGLMHAAGANVTKDVERMANLLQVSSAFGRSMESVDRKVMCKLVYPVLREGYLTKTIPKSTIAAAIASTAEGYPFPTNLDTDPPVGGLAPVTQQQLMWNALENGSTPIEFCEILEKKEEQKRPNHLNETQIALGGLTIGHSSTLSKTPKRIVSAGCLATLDKIQHITSMDNPL